MPNNETIRLEAAFMTGDDVVLDFEGRITKHHIPRDHVQIGADGVSRMTSLIAGEYVVVTGLPAGFDLKAGWNRITCPSLGWREITHEPSAEGEGEGAVRLNLKRKRPDAI